MALQNPPNIFISATSGDLRSVRGIVKNALLTIGCYPVEQTHFPPDYRAVRDMLQERIEACQALVHIVGMRYGAEPEISALPPGTPRRSYTQMEYDIGKALQKKRGAKRFRVYVFVCPEDFPYDPEPDIENAEKRALQRTHRQAILQGDALYETPGDSQALEMRIHALREETMQVLAAQRRRQSWLWGGIIAVLLLSFAGGYGLYRWLPSRTAEAVRQKLDADFDADSVAKKLHAEIETRFKHDLEEAHKQQQNWQVVRELERQRDLALARADDVVATIRDVLAGNSDPVFREATHILEQQGGDAALAYLESHKADLLSTAERAATQVQAAEDKLRQALQPLLLQADLYATKLQWNAALEVLRQVADKAPRWFEARLRLGGLLFRLARYSDAEKELKVTLDLVQGDVEQAIAFSYFAALLQTTNRLAEAEPLMRQALAVFEKNYGVDNPAVATGLSNLALLLQTTNRLAEAETLMRRALAINEKNFGMEDPAVASSLNRLALLLHTTNRFAEAESLMRKALKIDEKSYGPEHPTVATDLNSLGLLLQETNRPIEAEPLIRRALAINEKSYGGEHPDVATNLGNLASLLLDTNRLAEAERLMRRALTIDEKNYGSEDPSVAIRLNNLAQLLQATNRLDEAERLMRRALTIDEKSYGKEHFAVARDLNNLALLLQITNRYVEAEPLMRRALAIDEKSYGAEHSAVARDLNNLALLLRETNRFAEALPLMKRALAIFEKSYGAEHPNVATELNNIAQLLGDANFLTESEGVMRRALEIDENSYGEEHPVVARDLTNLALLLFNTNHFAEAEPLMRKALAIFEKSYGSENPKVATALNNLALLLQGTNRPAEAEPLLRRALAIDEKNYGPEHPDVATNLNNLAELLQDTSRLAEAEPLMRRAVLNLLRFTYTTGYQHPNLQAVFKHYQQLLGEMQFSTASIIERLNKLGSESGYSAAEWQALQAQLSSKTGGESDNN